MLSLSIAIMHNKLFAKQKEKGTILKSDELTSPIFPLNVTGQCVCDYDTTVRQETQQQLFLGSFIELLSEYHRYLF